MVCRVASHQMVRTRRVHRCTPCCRCACDDAHEAERVIDISSGSLKAEHRRGRGHQGDHAGAICALKNAMSFIFTQVPSCISPSARSGLPSVSDTSAAAYAYHVACLQRARPFLKARDESFRTVCLQKRDSITLRRAIDPRSLDCSREVSKWKQTLFRG